MGSVNVGLPISLVNANLGDAVKLISSACVCVFWQGARSPAPATSLYDGKDRFVFELYFP